MFFYYASVFSTYCQLALYDKMSVMYVHWFKV